MDADLNRNDDILVHRSSGCPASRGLQVALVLTSLLWVVPSSAAQGTDVGSLVDGIESRLERMGDFSADFIQILEDPLNPTREEGGHLYLKSPRRMRWEYANGDLFLSDGDTLFQHVPSDNQVMYEEVGESFDERVPIAFLVGQSDLRQEFSRISSDSAELGQVPGTRVLRMVPRREGDLEEVMIEVDPDSFDIQRLRLSYIDGAASDFRFLDIQTNTGLADSLFEFQIPDGVELIEGFVP